MEKLDNRESDISVGNAIKKRRIILLQSILAFWLGTLLLLFPRGTARSIIFIIGIYLILDGGTTLLWKAAEKSKVAVALGAIAVIIGVIALMKPMWLGFPLIVFLAGWALIHGLMNAGEFISIRSNRRLAFWFGLSGVVLIGLAIWMFSHLGANAFLLIRWLGLFGVIYGYSLLGASYELKRSTEKPEIQGIRKVESKKIA